MSVDRINFFVDGKFEAGWFALLYAKSRMLRYTKSSCDEPMEVYDVKRFFVQRYMYPLDRSVWSSLFPYSIVHVTYLY